MARHEVGYAELCKQVLNLSKGKDRTSETIGDVQPMEVPKWKWESISMDFMMGLPRTSTRYDAIWIIVDRLTRSAHFLPIRANYPMEKLAQPYIQEIVRLYGIPSTIISDRDPRFTSRFWGAFQKAFGTKLYLSITYHP